MLLGYFYRLKSLQENGIVFYLLRREIQKIYGSKGLQEWEGVKIEKSPPEAIKLVHLQGAFIIFAVGMTSSILAFLSELYATQLLKGEFD